MTRKQKQAEIANVSTRTIENWYKSKPQLIEAIDAFIDLKKMETFVEFRKNGDEIWFLLDESRLTIQQRDAISEILSLSYRDRNSFYNGERFEVLIDKEEAKKIINIIKRDLK